MRAPSAAVPSTTSAEAYPTTQAPTGNSLTWDAKGLLAGYMLPAGRHPALYRCLGVELPPMVWNEHVTGHRLLIAPEPVGDRTASGLLYKPNSVMEKEKLQTGAGWVISVGPLVGSSQGHQPHPVGVLVRRPFDLLGARVTFRAYSGTSLRISKETDEWQGELLVMTDRDLMTVSWEGGV